MLFARAKTRTNPLFYPERLEYRLAHDPARLERMRTEQHNVDVLVWNVFASLDSDEDREFLAGQLQALAGSRLRTPLSLSLWTGVHREPMLRPSAAYQRWLDHHPDVDDPSPFTRPFEVAVRLEAPEVLALIDATLDAPLRGTHGRDRLVELIDAGAEHARAVGKHLVVTCLYQSGTPVATEVSARLNDLRSAERRAEAMPWHPTPPAVELREMSWQRLLRLWDRSREGLALSRQPVKRFEDYAAQLGLR